MATLTQLRAFNLVEACGTLTLHALAALEEYNRVVGEEFGRGEAPLPCYDQGASRCDEFVGVRDGALAFQGFYGGDYELCQETFFLPVSVLYEDGWAERMRQQCVEDERIRAAEIAELHRLRAKYPQY